MESEPRFVFPRWTNAIRPLVGVALVVVPAYLIVVVWLGFSPKTINAGYQPVQPVPYSHALHVGKLGIDCRYCHNTVERGAKAALPPTQTCMNCHQRVRAKSEKLALVRQSAATGEPIRWVRVHDLPDYVYFDHSAHVTRGVSCVECHGRIDKMEVVRQVAPLSMGWCLSCHRNPDAHLRPPELVTRLDWVPEEDRETVGRRIRQANNIHPSTDCSTCHR